MNVMEKSFIAACLVLLSGSAFAAPHLTAKECHAYPFVPLKHEVTHHQLMNELGELEAVGYSPEAGDYDYPRQINHAERKLHAEYQHDCVTASAAAKGLPKGPMS